MMELQRITTQYSEEQDRLRLSGEGPEGSLGQTQVLWLTQRLLNRLLPHLTSWLEQQGRQGLHADLLLGFQQQAALAALEPQAPVQAPAASSAWLVRSVDIATGDDTVHLGFKEQETSPVLATVALRTQALRQWLGIVYQQYRAADWPLQAWPGWICEETPPKASAGQPALH